MFLCIDTTTSEAGITLTGFKRKEIDPYQASENILKVIDELVSNAGIELIELKGVFVIKGPGSFTGLRVGIAVANQLAHQLNIPIIGLTTDKWWKERTDEKDFKYLQTMNKAEVYADGSVIPIEELSGESLWLGQLSDEHKAKLPKGFKEITDLKTPEETWGIVIENSKTEKQNTISYELVEPYYGKDPMITKSKKRLSI